MRLPRPRISVRLMMVIVAAVAVFLTVYPWVFSRLGRYIWWEGGPGWGIGYDSSRPIILQPRLGFVFIPGLSLVVAWPNPRRRVIWAAIGADLLALMSWALLRRIFGMTPGSVLIWPDDIPKLLPGGSYSLYWRQTSILFHPPFWVSNVGEIVDVLSLFGLLLILVSLLMQPVPLRLRALALFFVNAYQLGEWVALMARERYWGVGQPPLLSLRLGSVIRPTVSELMEGALLIALLTYLALILVRPGFINRAHKST
jgi:hypothetical protein